MPPQAITMGVATILEAREVILLATGEHKAEIVLRAVEGGVHADVAATFLQQHPAATVYLDPAAAEQLTRVRTPWLVQEVEWTAQSETEAVIWLSLQTGKPILHLATDDYREHHLASLVSRHGSAEPLNGQVFNVLISKIRGKSRLPRGQDILVFSPHPDDDVISMGGLLRKLVENGNRVTVAYQTSGNIAVFDHEVRRYLDFMRRAARRRRPRGPRSRSRRWWRRWRRISPARSPAMSIRPSSRTSSASSARARRRRESRRSAWPPTARVSSTCPSTGRARCARTRFPDSMWTSSPRCWKRPGPRWSSPPATSPIPTAPTGCASKRSRAAWCVTAASRPGCGCTAAPGRSGAWARPRCSCRSRTGRCARKVQAIFRHESQKDSAPFPGADPREFWERVVDRNRETADMLKSLGLPAYRAMEAYVVSRDGHPVEAREIPTSSLAEGEG